MNKRALIESVTIPADEQTTVRLSKSLQGKLKTIAALERVTLMDVTESALRDFSERYAVMSGRDLSARDHR